MTRLTGVFAAVTLLVFLTAPIHAQSWEVSGLVGYTPSAAIDRRARELNQLDIDGGFTWGVQAGRFFTPRWGGEVLWSQPDDLLAERYWRRKLTMTSMVKVSGLPLRRPGL